MIERSTYELKKDKELFKIQTPEVHFTLTIALSGFVKRRLSNTLMMLIDTENSLQHKKGLPRRDPHIMLLTFLKALEPSFDALDTA